MEILFIGGTSFVGRHAAEAAIARGHRPTFFHRGETGADLFRGYEHVLGDRNRDLGLLSGRTWDAAVDLSAYVPRQVAQAADALAGAVDRYCYVSTVSAYKLPSSPGFDEESPLYRAEDLDDPTTETVDATTYGPLKALGEAAAREGFGEKAFLVRPTYVIGPHDATERFTYWVRRAGGGGEMLAAGPPDAPVQLIDGRDLGEFIVHLLEHGAEGPFNAVGPATQLTWEEMLTTCAQATHSDAKVTWADAAFLRAQGAAVELEFPLWLRPEASMLMRCDGARATAAGLRLRPLHESVRDIWAWDDARGAPELARPVSRERERELLAQWRDRSFGRL
jgi:2'-hydroxyisoflavone reductase